MPCEGRGCVGLCGVVRIMVEIETRLVLPPEWAALEGSLPTYAMAVPAEGGKEKP